VGIPAAGTEDGPVDGPVEEAELPVEVGELEVEPHAVGCAPAEPASLDADGGATVRSLWQYRHLIASSWISSAQYGHFFTSCLHDPSEAQAYRPCPAGMSLG
jgi:hypothetical protein